MLKFKQSLIAFVSVLALVGVATLVTPSPALGQKGGPPEAAASSQNLKDGKTPVTVAGTVAVGNIVQTQPAVPPGAFSVVLNNVGAISGPDPEGTSYAITSVTVANTSSVQTYAVLGAVWGATGDCKSFSSDTTGAEGPQIVVPAGGTVHLTFPQPFVLSARPGAAACLGTSIGGADARFTVVGYRF